MDEGEGKGGRYVGKLAGAEGRKGALFFWETEEVGTGRKMGGGWKSIR